MVRWRRAPIVAVISRQAGNEITWWEKLNIKPLEIAKQLWEQTHPKSATPYDVRQPATPENTTSNEQE